jgi:hypothetical protein
MKIKVELVNLVTGEEAIAYGKILEDTVNLDQLLASIPKGYQYLTYWVTESPSPTIERLKY